MTGRHVHENDPPLDPGYLGQADDAPQTDQDIPEEIKASIDIYDEGREMADFEASPAGKQLIDDQKEALQEAFNDWLALDDPTSDEAKACHLKGRVAAEVINAIRNAIDKGHEAEQYVKDNT